MESNTILDSESVLKLTVVDFRSWLKDNNEILGSIIRKNEEISLEKLKELWGVFQIFYKSIAGQRLSGLQFFLNAFQLYKYNLIILIENYDMDFISDIKIVDREQDYLRKALEVVSKLKKEEELLALKVIEEQKDPEISKWIDLLAFDEKDAEINPTSNVKAFEAFFRKDVIETVFGIGFINQGLSTTIKDNQVAKAIAYILNKPWECFSRIDKQVGNKHYPKFKIKGRLLLTKLEKKDFNKKSSDALLIQKLGKLLLEAVLEAQEKESVY